MKITIIFLFCLIGIVANPINTPERQVAEIGTFIKFNLFFNRIIPNGDQLTVYGHFSVLFEKYLNKSIISGHFNVVVDLNWVEGVQRVNFTQNIESRKLEITFYEGTIIQEILIDFSEGEEFYNPIYLDLTTIKNRMQAWIWSYPATFTRMRTTIWGYQNLSVYDYTYHENQIGINITYEVKTGLLIYSKIQFQQSYGIGSTINNYLIVSLHSTNILFDSPKDYSSLLIFLALTTLIVFIPLLTTFIWFVRKPKRVIIGGE
ncbi:MAG: hypothetical protein ACFFAE_16745 [Candidatus Hodarchaeota archaeon]